MVTFDCFIPGLLLTYQNVSWSTSEAPSSCWTWCLGAAPAGGTGLWFHTLVGRWYKRRASSAGGTGCHPGGVGAAGSCFSGARGQSWNSWSLDGNGSSCRGRCWGHRRTSPTSKGSWCLAGNDEESQRTTAGRHKMFKKKKEKEKDYYKIL